MAGAAAALSTFTIHQRDRLGRMGGLAPLNWSVKW